MQDLIILTAKDIAKIINLKGKEKGVEVVDIEITNRIELSGIVIGKRNSKFSGSIFIKDVYNNKVFLEIQNFNINSLGFIKGASNMVLKSMIKNIDEDCIDVKGNNVTIDIGRISDRGTLYNASITEVYIKDKSLYIIGTNLNEYLKI